MTRRHTRVVRARACVLGGLLSLCTTGAALATDDSTAPVTAADGPILGVTKESAGAVTVTLTPKRFEAGHLYVAIGVNTHTVNDLHKYDLTQIVTLKAEGKDLHPTSAPKLRGHHNRGELVFVLQALPQAMSLEIRGLDQPELRVLSWP